MRDRLIELIQNFADGTYTSNGIIVDGTRVDDVADYLLANSVIIPTADVEEVVRCKDCKWWYNEMDCRNTSGLYRFVPNGDWFCASGERKDT